MGLPLNLKSDPKLRKSFPAGSIVKMVQPARHPKYGVFDLVVPHHLHFALRTAQENLKESQKYFQEILKKSHKGDSNIWQVENDDTYFKFFSHLSTAVIFSCTAMELHTINVARGKGIFELKHRGQKTEFPRIPLVDRIGTYIPRELKIKSIKTDNPQLWDRFYNLVQQRHTFIHPDWDRLYNIHETEWDKSYFGLSLSGQCEDCLETAISVIKYYWEGELPEWLKDA
jgi:hypothetical protein